MSAYRSILPQRTRSIEAEDFRRELNLSVHANGFGFAGSGIPDAELLLWNRMMRVSPAGLSRIYAEAFQRPINLEVHFLSKYNRQPVDTHFGINVDGDDFFGSVKFLEGRKLESEGSSFEVNPDARGNGLGKAWLKSMVELTLVFGNEDLKFLAGSENGAYAWGKAGVPMNMAPEQSDKRTNLSRTVIRRLEAVRPFLSPADYSLARDLARFSMKDDINRLAAMTAVVPIAVLDDLRAKDSVICNRLAESYALRCSADGEKLYLVRAFEGAAKQGRELSLPRFLLSHTGWEARVDFSNAGEMQTIGAYLGGWKTIMPKSRDRDLALQL